MKTLGDERQLPGIDGSTSARLLVETARSQGQPYLDVSQRCKAWRGVHDALRRATEDPNADIAYLKANLPVVAISKPTDAVALAPGAEILVRDNATRGEIAEALPRPPAPRDDRQVVRGRDDAELWRGDRVVCRENVWQHGHLVLGNGERGEIVTVGPRAVVVEGAGTANRSRYSEPR